MSSIALSSRLKDSYNKIINNTAFKDFVFLDFNDALSIKGFISFIDHKEVIAYNDILFIARLKNLPEFISFPNSSRKVQTPRFFTAIIPEFAVRENPEFIIRKLLSIEERRKNRIRLLFDLKHEDFN